MWIEVTHRYCRIKRAKKDEERWLSEYLSFRDDKAFFRRRGKWRADTKIRMLNATTGTFPTGFLASVRAAAKKDKIKIKLLDKRGRAPKADPLALLDWLRDYQIDAIDAAKKSTTGIFHHATGAGKTEIQIGLTEVYPVRWLLLTHKIDLLSQTAERFAKRTGEEVGFIGAGKYSPKRITIATFHTINSMLRRKKTRGKIEPFLRSILGVMVDECHVVAADTFWRVTMAVPNAHFRYGFSGTPFARGDKKSIYVWGALGPVIHKISADYLVKKGVLARPRVRMIEVRQNVEGETWQDVYRLGIVESKIRNKAVIMAAKRATKPCLLFVDQVKHGQLLEHALRGSGQLVEFVWGKKSLHVRRAAIRRLVHGDTDILVCNVIFQEGIDIPELQSIIAAQGRKSMITVLQRLGRGTRKHDSEGNVTKSEFEAYDIADKGCGMCGKKGIPKHRSCKWLERHARKRLAAYASEKFEVVVERGQQLVLAGVI